MMAGIRLDELRWQAVQQSDAALQDLAHMQGRVQSITTKQNMANLMQVTAVAVPPSFADSGCKPPVQTSGQGLYDGLKKSCITCTAGDLPACCSPSQHTQQAQQPGNLPAHLAANKVRRHLGKQLAAAPDEANPSGCAHLVA